MAGQPPLKPQAPELPQRVGGRPSLDFVNTLDARHELGTRDYLPDYPALLAWVEGADASAPNQPPAPSGSEPLTVVLARIAAGDPAAAASVHARAVRLRESLYAVFSAAIMKRQVDDADLADLNAELCMATDHHVLRPAPAGGVRDGWLGVDTLDSPLWPLTIDAWDILTSAEIDRVHECPGEGCGWLFLDTSRSGTRRWCDMRTCGNRAKVRSHYARHDRTRAGA